MCPHLISLLTVLCSSLRHPTLHHFELTGHQTMLIVNKSNIHILFTPFSLSLSPSYSQIVWFHWKILKKPIDRAANSTLRIIFLGRHNSLMKYCTHHRSQYTATIIWILDINEFSVSPGNFPLPSSIYYYYPQTDSYPISTYISQWPFMRFQRPN